MLAVAVRSPRGPPKDEAYHPAAEQPRWLASATAAAHCERHAPWPEIVGKEGVMGNMSKRIKTLLCGELILLLSLTAISHAGA
jgi:hypothetical protein